MIFNQQEILKFMLKLQEYYRNSKLLLGFVIAFIPFVIWMIAIYWYGVNIPHEDQWFNPRIAIEQYFSGNFQLSTIFQQHNESRKVFPTLISLLLTIIFQEWNLHYEMILGLAISLLICLLVLLLLFKTNPGHNLENLLIVGIFNYLLLSPSTYIMHLFSITFERLLPEAALLVNALIYLFPLPSYVKILVFAISAIIAQYSYAGGIVIWLLSIPLVLFLSHKKQRIKIGPVLIYGLLFCLSSLVYFWNYYTPPHHSKLSAILNFSILDMSSFGLAFLGNPFSSNYEFSIAIGLILFIVYVGLLLLALVSSLDKAWVKFHCLPWFVIGLYSISQAALATITRLPMSHTHALRPDYIIHPIYLVLANLALIAILSHYLSKNYLRKTGIIVMCFIVGLYLSYNFDQKKYHQLVIWHQDLQHFKACIQLIDFYEIESYNLLGCPGRAIVPEEPWVQGLDRLGLLKPGIVKSFKTENSSSNSGTINQLKTTPEGFIISGWAAINMQPADAVVVTYEEKNQPPSIVGIFSTGLANQDVSEQLNNTRLISAGWQGIIKKDLLPPQARVNSLRAYAFDTQNNRLFALNQR